MTERVVAVFKVLGGVEKPTVERAKRAVLKAITFVRTGAIGAGKDALRAAAKGIHKLSVVDRFRDAYILGVRRQLNQLRGQPVTYDHWAEWDASPDDACLTIAGPAKTRQHCVPRAGS